MQHRRLPEERCQPCCSFIYFPPPPPGWQPSQHRWTGCEWIRVHTLWQLLLLSRCPSAPWRKYNSQRYQVPQSYFWVFKYFSSASCILLSSHVLPFPSVICFHVSRRWRKNLLLLLVSDLAVGTYTRTLSFPLSAPTSCPWFRFGDLYRGTFCGASLLSSAQTSVTCIDVCFMSPVTQYKGTVVFTLPVFYTSQHPAERAGGGYTTHAQITAKDGFWYVRRKLQAHPIFIWVTGSAGPWLQRKCFWQIHVYLWNAISRRPSTSTQGCSKSGSRSSLFLFGHM